MSVCLIVFREYMYMGNILIYIVLELFLKGAIMKYKCRLFPPWLLQSPSVHTGFVRENVVFLSGLIVVVVIV